MTLLLNNINKSFSGTHILKDIHFEAQPGVPLGFLGRNGAGKTTTIRILMDVFAPDSGEILYDGKPFDRDSFKIGYMPEERGLYPGISVQDQLVYLGELKGMSTGKAKESAKYWVDRFELGDYFTKNLETLSKGNQQKIQIVQSVIDDPDILILDEPFSGLDPVNAQSLSNVMMEFVDKGRIVIFSSHQMASVEQFCDDIVLINKGEIVLDGSLQEIKREKGFGKKRLSMRDWSDDELAKRLRQFGDFPIDQDKESLIIQFDKEPKEIMQLLADLGGDVELYADYEPSLNDIFIETVGERHA